MGKWALVTGAAGGIGLEFAKILKAEGFNLFLIDIDEKSLDLCKQDLTKDSSIEINTMAIDLSDSDSALTIYKAVNESGIEIDTLINNAGFGMFGRFHETDWQREQKMIMLHINTPTQLVKLFLPHMLTRKSGKILNVASLAAFHPGPLMCMYYSTKAYLLSFTTSVATELEGTGVNMTVLCPGITRTGFQKAVGSDDPKIKVNMACAFDVAIYGYRALKAGRVLAVPGRLNKLTLFLRRFMTYTFQARCIKYIQEKNRQKQVRN